MTGTDTGVGKTWVCCRLLESWRRSGLSVAALKAVESGLEAGGTSDDEALLAAVGGHQETHCQFTFSRAVAPGVAAEDAGVVIDFARIAAQVDQLSNRDLLLVEGAGGWLVPLGQGRTIADLARYLALPVLVVGRAGLGTINHTVLTVEAIHHRGLAVAAVALDQLPSDDADLARSNQREIQRMVHAPVFLLPGELTSLASLGTPS